MHQVTLAVAILALFALVALDWPQLDLVTRVVFAALSGLGVAMVLLARWAGRVTGSTRRQAIGFNLVALTDAFVVVAVLDSGAGPIVIIGSGVAVASIGHVVMIRMDARSEAAASVGSPHRLPIQRGGSRAAPASERLAGREPRA